MALSPLDRLVRAALTEQWAPLPVGGDDEHWWAAHGYWVSTAGRVLAVLPRCAPGRRLVFKALRVERRTRRRPHLRTNLHVRAGGHHADRAVRVHRLVAAAWLPAMSPGAHLVRHRNGDGLDNRVSNLLRGTWSENLRDQYALGERGRGPSSDDPPF